MTWIRIDDGFADHPKVLALSDTAFRLYACSLCWAGRRGTGGFIAERDLGVLAGMLQGEFARTSANIREHVRELVEARVRPGGSGLWVEIAGGWMIHDWHDYNPDAAEVAQKRAAAVERMRRLRAKRKGPGEPSSREHGANKPRTFAESDSEQTAHVRQMFATPTRPLLNTIPPIVPQEGTEAHGDAFALSPPAQKGQSPGNPKRSHGQGLNEAQRPFEGVAIGLLAELSAARLRVIPRAEPLHPVPDNLRNICNRLASGRTVEDVRHVIAVREAQVRANPSVARWFNAVTPFTADNFTRDRDTTLEDAARPAEPPPSRPYDPRNEDRSQDPRRVLLKPRRAHESESAE